MRGDLWVSSRDASWTCVDCDSAVVLRRPVYSSQSALANLTPQVDVLSSLECQCLEVQQMIQIIREHVLSWALTSETCSYWLLSAQIRIDASPPRDLIACDTGYACQRLRSVSFL